MSESDTQARFSATTIAAIKNDYQNRCSICLCTETSSGAHAAHLFDAAGGGADQVRESEKIGLLEPGYQRSGAKNGAVQCAKCHLGYFTPNVVVLSLPLPLLDWLINKHFDDSSITVRKRLQDLPYSNKADDLVAKPYYGLYTLETLKPSEVVQGDVRLCLITSALPPLSILRNGKWVEAPLGKLSTDPEVARIFNVKEVTGLERRAGFIPLSPEDPQYAEQRFWRIPADPAAILATLMIRLKVTTIHTKVLERANQLKSWLVINALPPIQEVTMREEDGSRQRDGGLPGGGEGETRAGQEGGGGNNGEGQGGREHHDGVGDRLYDEGMGSSRLEGQPGGWNHDEKILDLAGNDGSQGESGSDGPLLDSNDEADVEGQGIGGHNRKPQGWRFGPDLTSDHIILQASGQVLF